MSLEKMLECVKKEMEKLDLKHSESHFKKYAQDKKRCVALLQAGKKRIMSFSGFWDCEDDEARNVLNGQFYVDVIEAFHNISQACQAKLAILSSEVVDDIIRYELDSKCQLVQKGPLRDELTSVKSEDEKGFLKGAYSCCERKILAELKQENILHSKTATLYVKFTPCLKCFGALQSWTKKNNIDFRLVCPSL